MWALISGAATTASAQEQSPARVSLPTVKQRVEPAYPVGAHGHADVVLEIVVEKDGSVGDVRVSESAGTELDQAAESAVRQWKFVPAKRDGKVVPSKILVRVHMVPPTVETPDAAQPADPGRVQDPSPAPRREVEVRGQRGKGRTTSRGASHYRLDRDTLEAAPAEEGADVLKRAPGLFIGRAEGPAVAHRYMLRGFDAEHGQDLEFTVGGLPINLPSHIHGQGYADLSFLVPGTVRRMSVAEGVYDPQQGDFAVAGSLDLDLGVKRRGWLLSSGYGSFDTFQQRLVLAPRGEDEETFAAGQLSTTDGFGKNREGTTASVIVQNRFGSGAWTYRAIGFVHGARASLAGVLREDDVTAGRVGFYDAYPDATAQNQSAQSTRGMAGLFADFRAATGATGHVGVWLGRDAFRVQENFTGYVQRSSQLEKVAGRGDLIEQQNDTSSLGLIGWYRTRPARPTKWLKGTFELGVEGRVDQVEQAQNLLDAAVRNQTWDRRIDAQITAGDVGLFGDAELAIQRLRVRAGARADAVFFDVDDRLGNFAPVSRPDDSFIEGFRRSAAGVAAGPRASASYLVFDWMSLRAAYGEGYRSPQARTLSDGETAPFTKVRSADLGTKLRWDERLELTLAGYYTHLSDDVAFEPRAGRLERIGASRRLGGTAYLLTRPVPWLIGSYSVTVVDAELLEPPPPSADDPSPPFTAGQRLPYVPPVVARVDYGVKRSLNHKVAGQRVTGRAGLGLTYLSSRPLPFGKFARPVALADVGAGVQWGAFDLSMDVFNVFDAQYAAVEFNFPSNWSPNRPASRVPQRHTAAGAPLSWMVRLGARL